MEYENSGTISLRISLFSLISSFTVLRPRILYDLQLLFVMNFYWLAGLCFGDYLNLYFFLQRSSGGIFSGVRHF